MSVFKISPEYEKSFFIDWIQKLNWADIESSKESLSIVKDKIETFIQIAFIHFCKSALSGEYIAKDIVGQLDQIKVLISEDNPNICTNNYEEEANRLFRLLNNDIGIVVSMYKVFILQINDKLKNIDHKYIFISFSEQTDNCNSQIMSDVIDICVELCAKDHYSADKESDIERLMEIRDYLSRIKKHPRTIGEIAHIYSYLYDKCSFLLKKTLYFRKSAEYIIDFIGKEIKYEDIKTEYLVEFDNRFEYAHVNDVYRRDSFINAIEKKCNLNKAEFSDYIILMRYYMKNKRTNNQIENVIDNFRECISEFNIKRDFDKYAIGTIDNYISNCYFSTKLRDNLLSIRDFQKELDFIQHLQETTKIYNFYPYLKSVEFLLNRIRDGLDDGMSSKELEDLHTSAADCQNRLRNSIEWCHKTGFYPFQLPYWECLKKVKPLKLAVFTPSTFAKPMDYANLRDKLIEFQTIISELGMRIAIRKEQADVNELRSELKNAKSEVTKIATFFTAVITFIFGAINIFSPNVGEVNLLSKVANSAVLGLLLLVFICLVHLLLHPNRENFWTYKNVLCIIILSGYLSFIIWFYNRDESKIAASKDASKNQIEIAPIKPPTIQQGFK